MQITLALLGLALALFGLCRGFQVIQLIWAEVASQQQTQLLPLALTTQILGLSLLGIWLMFLVGYLLRAQ